MCEEWNKGMVLGGDAQISALGSSNLDTSLSHSALGNVRVLESPATLIQVDASIRAVLTPEFKHQPDALDLRGGALTADHVDILGSSPLNSALLKIVAGKGELVQQKIGSKIMEYVGKMSWD